MMTEEQKTDAVKNCKTFEELEAVIIENAPFISYSRITPIEWSSIELLERISIARNSGEFSYVTRANGIREKVIELCSTKTENTTTIDWGIIYAEYTLDRVNGKLPQLSFSDSHKIFEWFKNKLRAQ